MPRRCVRSLTTNSGTPFKRAKSVLSGPWSAEESMLSGLRCRTAIEVVSKGRRNLSHCTSLHRLPMMMKKNVCSRSLGKPLCRSFRNGCITNSIEIKKRIDLERSFMSTRWEMSQEKYLLTSECIGRHQYSCKHHCFHEVLPGISATASHPR